MMKRPQSETCFAALKEVIPGGVNSPVRTCQAVGMEPLVAAAGKGAVVTDVDGYEYIDYCCSWGALIHGHAHPQIVEKAAARMAMGSTFGITTPIEEALARKVVEMIPGIELVRFVSSGSEATMSAARLARGYTGRPLIVKFSGNYHGHADFFLVQAGSGVAQLNRQSSSQGIPDEMVRHTLSIAYNDLAAVRDVFQRYPDAIAGVIVEPVVGNMGCVLPEKGFLETLREETERAGALLIFDEVITGFRVAPGGAQQHFGISPDLTCLGKIVGGGFPAAAFGGKRKIMEAVAPLGQVYQAGTLSGNPVAMEAGLQALKLLDQPGFYERLEEKTRRLVLPIQEALQGKNGTVQHMASMFTLFFGQRSVSNFEEAKQIDTQAYSALFRFLFARGIYFPPSPFEACFLSSQHTDEQIDKTAEAVVAFLKDWQ